MMMCEGGKALCQSGVSFVAGLHSILCVYGLYVLCTELSRQTFRLTFTITQTNWPAIAHVHRHIGACIPYILHCSWSSVCVPEFPILTKLDMPSRAPILCTYIISSVLQHKESWLYNTKEDCNIMYIWNECSQFHLLAVSHFGTPHRTASDTFMYICTFSKLHTNIYIVIVVCKIES